MIKLIIFDLWHTLAYRDVAHSSTSQILAATKVNIPKEKFIKIFEASLQTKKWRSQNAAYKNLCYNMGLPATSKNISLLSSLRGHAEAQTKIYPHTISMLQQLKKQGYQIGLISNSTVFSLKYIQRLHLLEYIDYPLFSFNVGFIKPDPRIFQAMLRLSHCHPAEALMIGDKLNDDVLPAKKLGLNAILYTNYRQLKKDLAAYEIFLK